MAFTTINKSSDYFNTVLYQSNNGSAQSITGVNFQPDFLWVKDRTAGGGHVLVDAVRGSTKMLSSNSTSVEVTRSDQVTSFDSNGFSLGADSGGFINYSTNNNVSWNWKANGTGSSNTDGSITSTVSVNTTSGFSIVKYTGNGLAGATIGHGLGAVPKMTIIKSMTAGEDWIIPPLNDPTNYIVLNSTGADGNGIGPFNNTAATSSVFSVGTWGTTNGNSQTLIAYCFADVQGFSKIGSYIGNGNATTPTFTYLGFKPAFVLIKNLSQADAWFLHDSKRDGFNDDNEYLRPNLTDADSSGINRIRLLSNGFSVPTTDKSHNVNGNNYLYMAFAEAPLVGTNNVPANAR